MSGHQERAHAVLSASGASRWIACPPSARLEEQFPDTSSEFAEEGTLAHELAELELRKALFEGIPYKSRLKELRACKYYSAEMDEYVETYVEYVLHTFQTVKDLDPSAELLIEDRSDFSHIVQDGFGTIDACILGNKTIHVIDLKYGKGVKVSAISNPQLRLYGLGSLYEYGLIYRYDHVKTTVVQPRLDHIETDTVDVSTLLEWATNTVKPAARKAFAGEGEFNPGDACRWCRAAPRCRALAEYNVEQAKLDFADLLSDGEIIDLYGRLGVFTAWVDALKAHVQDHAIKGKQWPGYKLVEGRSRRVWAEKAHEVLVTEGVNLFEQKARTITDVEKEIGKKRLEELKITDKPPGKPTLVPEDDPRRALDPTTEAINDFSI